MAKPMRPRVGNMVAPWRARHRDTRIDQGTPQTAAPVRGRAVSGSWYHPTSRPHRKRPPQSAQRDGAMRRLGNGSRFALPGARRRLLRQMGIVPVRSGALRSSSPAFPVPLRSDRGSLARSRRLLVLVMASICCCADTLSAIERTVNRQSLVDEEPWVGYSLALFDFYRLRIEW